MQKNGRFRKIFIKNYLTSVLEIKEEMTSSYNKIWVYNRTNYVHVVRRVTILINHVWFIALIIIINFVRKKTWFKQYKLSPSYE